MTIVRRYSNGVKLVGNAVQADIGTGSQQVAAGSKLPGDAPLDSRSAAVGDGLRYNGSSFVPSSPFYYRLDPSSGSSFGTARGTVATPTWIATTDNDGRPIVRFTFGTGNSFVPLLTPAGAEVLVEGEFFIEVWANWATCGAAAPGVMWNTDPKVVGAYTGFQCGRVVADATLFDRGADYVYDNKTVPFAATADASVSYCPLWVHVYLNLSSGFCSFSQSDTRDLRSNGFKELRHAALRTAAKKGIGLVNFGGACTFDVAKLIVWKPEYLW